MKNYTDLSPSALRACLEGCVEQQCRPSRFGGGFIRQFYYANGYAASVVKHDGSYGSHADLWELAVLRNVLGSWTLAYDTPITDDVCGYLTEEQVVDLCEQIKSL